MTIQEYDKVFKRLDSDSRRLIKDALEFCYENTSPRQGYSLHDDACLERMISALNGDVPKYVPCKLEWKLDEEEGTLDLTFKSCTPIDVLVEKQRFLNDHLIAGEWPVVDTETSEDGLYTTYKCQRKSKSNRKRNKEEEAMKKNPVGHILSSLDKLPPEQKQALLNQLGV